MGIHDYREFVAWQRADDVRRLVRDLAKRQSFGSHAWLRAQLLRAANSACTNFAEGFLRFYPREFSRFITISRGSLGEVVEHLPDVVGLSLATEEEATKIRRLALRGQKAMAGLVVYLESLPPHRSHRAEARKRGSTGF